MNYALVGFGGMGRAVDLQAAQRGHRRVLVIKRGAEDGWRRLSESATDVAFEFTEGAAAEDNVVRLLGAGVSVVCGTTGWSETAALGRALRCASAGVVLAPNFSIGVQLFFRIAAQAARIFSAAGDYEPFVAEHHHRQKKDAPSGTARRLAEIVVQSDPRIEAIHEGDPDGVLPSNVLQVSSVRAGSAPGTHLLGFDGRHERVTLEHTSRSRKGFALGAVIAAEWIRDKQGLYRFEEVLEQILAERPCEID